MSTASTERTAAIFVFDGGCGFCARAAGALAGITGAAPPGSTSPLHDASAHPLTIASSRDVDFSAIGVGERLIERHALYVEPRGGARGAVGTGTGTGVEGCPPFLALGHEAIGHALRDHGRTTPWRLAGAVLLHPLMRAPAAIAYRLVADNRATASRVTGSVVKQLRRH